MVTQGRPIRRLPRRARIVMLLFVLPVLAISASTRSADDAKSDEPARAEEILLGRVSCDVRDGTLEELISQIIKGAEPARIVLDVKRLQDDCGISADTKVTLQAQQIRRQNALAIVLHPRGAGYYVKDGTIHVTSQRGVENEVHEIGNWRSDEVFSKTYAVYDLVRLARGDSGAIQVDYAPLVDRIKQEAGPGTWDDLGEITPYANNLSLVITHNARVHDAVAAFLSELRNSAVGGPE